MTACRDSGAKEPPALEAEFFAASPAALANAACASSDAEPMDVAIELRLLAGPDVSAESFARQTRFAQDYFAGHGVRLAAATPAAARVDARVAITGSARDVQRALDKAGVTADDTPRARAISAQAAAGPLRELVRRHAEPARDEIVVVMLERIVAPDSPLAAHIPNAAGLTLSPRLDERDDPNGDLRAALGLDVHSPIIVLSARDLDRLEPSLRDSTLAHELGHALGLGHHPSRDNLMAPDRRAGCVPVLEAEQLAAIR